MDNTLFGDKVYSNILLGYFSTYHQERIEELGIELTEKDKENKYIKKIINLIEDYNSKIN